jgi:hypothetical protein
MVQSNNKSNDIMSSGIMSVSTYVHIMYARRTYTRYVYIDGDIEASISTRESQSLKATT